MSHSHGHSHVIPASSSQHASLPVPPRPTFNPGYAANPLIRVDINKPAQQQPQPVHNRWHPQIPPVASVSEDTVFRVECLDWTGGQIKNDDSADDIHNVDLTQVHYLAGPIEVKSAEPGDLLVVDILDIGPLPAQMWGFTGIFAKSNGGGFLCDEYPEARKAIWDFHGIYASSRHIHGVRFAGLTHPGLMGCAPSQELLDTWNKRERALVATDPDRVPALATLPNKHGACLGAIKTDSAEWERIANEGARTVPPREHGGNCDIKNLSRGSRVYFPVYVNGANLSMGDLHFSQGDGEISFCGAIEMSGWLDLSVSLIKGGMTKYAINSPVFIPGPVEPRYEQTIGFEGISVDRYTGKQLYLDASLAYRNACLNAVEYLKKFGYSGEQAYIILGTAPVEGRISGIVDIPNACCTISIPTGIFDFPITPSSGPIACANRGTLALPSHSK